MTICTQAARCRKPSGLIVGLNATRNYTVRYSRGNMAAVRRVVVEVFGARSTNSGVGE